MDYQAGRWLGGMARKHEELCFLCAVPLTAVNQHGSIPAAGQGQSGGEPWAEGGQCKLDYLEKRRLF